MISYDDFRHEVQTDSADHTDTDHEIVRKSCKFRNDSGSTIVDFYRSLDGWWTWEAWRHPGTLDAEYHDASWDCMKDTEGEAIYDAYYELLKRHWI